MARITPKMALKIEKVARRLASNEDEFYDSMQEGLSKVCEMINGHTESYYVQYAYRRIQNYLKKTRKNVGRHNPINTEELDAIPSEPLQIGKKTSVPNYDDLT